MSAWWLVCLATAHCACTLNAVAVLPVTVERNKFVFDVDINAHTARFALDTGAQVTTLATGSAERLGVRLNERDDPMYGVGGVAKMYYGTPARFRIGGMTADGMMIAGSPLWGTRETWDGLFGMNMMAAYDLDLDIAGRHIIIYEPEGDCHRPTVALAPHLYSVPLLSVRNDRQAVVTLTINGHDIRALIDSGAPTSLMYRTAASHLGIDLSPLEHRGSMSIRGVGSLPVAGMSYTAPTVTLGSLRISNMPFTIIAQRNNGSHHMKIGSLLPNPDADEANREEMLLGADFMQKVHLWISHSSHTLIMQYPPLPSVLPK